MSKRPSNSVHPLIRKVAIEMAGSLYDDLMHDNERYAQWKAQCPELTPKRAEAMFIERMWPQLIESARVTLARMLAMPYPESMKEEISDALIKDHSLRAPNQQSKVMH